MNQYVSDLFRWPEIDSQRVADGLFLTFVFQPLLSDRRLLKRTRGRTCSKAYSQRALNVGVAVIKVPETKELLGSIKESLAYNQSIAWLQSKHRLPKTKPLLVYNQSIACNQHTCNRNIYHHVLVIRRHGHLLRHTTTSSWLCSGRATCFPYLYITRCMSSVVE